jgi:hypothetical protein
MKFYIKMKQLKSWFNTEASKVIEGLISGGETMLEGANVASFGEPTKFHEAYNHPEPDTTLNFRNDTCK